MEDTIITFETAKLAKEKGFNSPCPYYYCIGYKSIDSNPILKQHRNPMEDMKFLQPLKIGKGQPHLASAPTQSLLQKWLRENHEIIILPQFEGNEEVWRFKIYKVNKSNNQFHSRNSKDNFSTYEGALEEGLQKSLKLI